MVEKFITPKVFFVGQTKIHDPGVEAFLRSSGNEDFLEDIRMARSQGLSDAEILSSLFAKLCYRSLTTGKNANLVGVRDIQDNIVKTMDSGHMSVFEHVNFNFVITDCSRVFTHEAVRHRVGTAFSQTSGRYCRIENLQMVWDPILNPVRDLFEECMTNIENCVYLAECRLGLRKPNPDAPATAEAALQPNADQKLRWIPNREFDFTMRKKLTSAIRRIAPNGQNNELGFSLNLRALRHTVLLRTASFAEWEIRVVFDQIYRILKPMFPLMFYGAVEKEVDGLIEVSGLKCQPYELAAEAVLDEMSDDELLLYMRTRPKLAEKISA